MGKKRIPVALRDRDAESALSQLGLIEGSLDVRFGLRTQKSLQRMLGNYQDIYDNSETDSEREYTQRNIDGINEALDMFDEGGNVKQDVIDKKWKPIRTAIGKATVNIIEKGLPKFGNGGLANNINIEAEGGELVLQNDNGDVAIIPKRMRAEAMYHMDSGNMDAINSIVGGLPNASHYAENGSKFIKKNEPKVSKGKNVVVFAEAPIKGGDNYYMGDDNLPEELAEIVSRYEDLRNERTAYFNNDETRAIGSKIMAIESERFKNSPFVSNWSDKYTDDGSVRNLQDGFMPYLPGKLRVDYYNILLKEQELSERIDLSIIEFQNTRRNFIDHSAERDELFVTEGNKIKRFYAKHDPSINVDVVPSYHAGEEMQAKLQSLNEGDDVVILGHSGDRFTGIPNDSIASMVSKSKAENCYFGSCSLYPGSSRMISNVADTTNTNFYFKPIPDSPKNSGNIKTTWYGFNKDADDFLSGMYGVQDAKGTTMPLIEDVTHKKIGGVSKLKE